MASTDIRRTATWTARALTYFVYAFVLINEVILTLGFFLKLFGANPTAEFTQWAYRNLERVMAPFRGIFTPIEVGAGNSDVQPVLDTSILFAMLIYAIIGLALHSLIEWLAYRLAKLDARIEQEAAEAQLAAEAQRREQQIAAMAASAGAMNDVPNIQVATPDRSGLPAGSPYDVHAAHSRSGPIRSLTPARRVPGADGRGRGAVQHHAHQNGGGDGRQHVQRIGLRQRSLGEQREND